MCLGFQKLVHFLVLKMLTESMTQSLKVIVSSCYKTNVPHPLGKLRLMAEEYHRKAAGMSGETLLSLTFKRQSYNLGT